MISIPYGGLTIQDGGAATQALTTTAAQMTGWSGAKGQASASDSYNRDGDPSVRPDPTNNRMLVKGPLGSGQFVYEVDLDLSLVGGGAAQDVVAQLRKNAVLIPDASCRFSVSNSGRTAGSFTCIVVINPSDNPKNIADFADPSGTFTGKGGAPSTEVPIDIVLSTVSGTLTVTFEASHLTIKRLA